MVARIKTNFGYCKEQIVEQNVIQSLIDKIIFILWLGILPVSFIFHLQFLNI